MDRTRFIAWARSLSTAPWRTLHWLLATRPIRFTRFGTLYILFTVGVGAGAINTGNNLLYLILGILLGFIVVSGFLSDSGLWGVRSSWRPLESCYAGRPALFGCRLQKGWFPAVGVSVKAHWSDQQESHEFIHWVPARGQIDFSVLVTPQRRGWMRMVKESFSTRFPFGLFEKFHAAERTDQWLVYPAVLRLNLQSSELETRRSDSKPAQRIGLGAVPYHVRDFREGDPANRIHWKLSAKRQALLINEMEEEADQGDRLVVSQWPKGLTPEEIERLISFMASFAYSLIDEGRPVGLATPGITLPPEHSRSHLDRLLRYLALVDLGSEVEQKGSARSLSPGRDIDVLKLWRRGTYAA